MTMARDIPGSVMFACDRNTIRSVMAEAIMKHLFGHRVFVDSVGARLADDAADPFAVAVMQELGLDISGHRPKSFDDLRDGSLDLIVTFSPQAQHLALEFTRTLACDVEYWPVMHPADVEGSREVRLQAYRDVRDALFDRIKSRFPAADRPL